VPDGEEETARFGAPFRFQDDNRDMKTICVYCGSNAGNDPAYAAQAEALGARLAADGIALVYGGGNVGLMGIVADAVLANGGEVIGVIPQQLVDWEVAHRGVTRLEVVDSMHDAQGADVRAVRWVRRPARRLRHAGRNVRDADLAPAWPGQEALRLPRRQRLLAALMAMLDTMVRERFLHAEQRDDLWHGEDIDALLAWMRGYVPAQADKWLDEKRRSQLKLTPEDV
jgi:hypothetical protein